MSAPSIPKFMARPRWHGGISAFACGVLLIGCMLVSDTELPKSPIAVGDEGMPSGDVGVDASMTAVGQVDNLFQPRDMLPTCPTNTAPNDPPILNSVFWQPTVPDSGAIRLCQAPGSAVPRSVLSHGTVSHSVVSSPSYGWNESGAWESARMDAWRAYAQGEYVHGRSAHVPEYRLRVGDQLDLNYRLTHEVVERYELNVGDELGIKSLPNPELDQERLIIQPDGTITPPLIEPVRAAGKTVLQLRKELERRYIEVDYYKEPSITVIPLKTNSKLNDLLASVDRRYGQGGSGQSVTVTPEGAISLPAIGSVSVQGLTLQELQRELNERYRLESGAIEVVPELDKRAPRYFYVLGEVAKPGQYEMIGRTSVLQAISQAESWNNGANLRQIVILRRDDNWQLQGTIVDLSQAMRGQALSPAGDIWLSDSDVVIIPKNPILRASDFIELAFTRGLYGVLPVGYSINLAGASTL